MVPGAAGDRLTAQVGTLTTRIEELIAAIPAAQGADAAGTIGPGAGAGPGAARLDAITRLAGQLRGRRPVRR